MKSILSFLFRNKPSEIIEGSHWIFKNNGRTYEITRRSGIGTWVQQLGGYVETCWLEEDFLDCFYKEKK